ncbi:MAG: rod shape-determining protein MreD [Flavobacteriales bacterium]|nr:hypothetical protein [Flavobacteriales bacterium]MCB9167370.1 rod shape-determining protein MreD [Flavobacteriales bacterium]
MTSGLLEHIVRFVVLLGLQVLVLDHLVLFDGMMVPLLYILFLLMLPFNTPPWAMLLLGAVTGAAMDLFGHTPGMHTSACVLLAFLRPLWLRLVAPRDGYEFGLRPTVQRMGLAWSITYLGPLVLIHHIWLFFFELHRFDRIFSTLSRSVLSALLTLVLCLIAQYLTGRSARGRG